MSRLIDITIFPDVRASTFSVEKMTLTALRDDILATTAPTKKALPLLKLAAFGSTKTDKGCLRHDKNVLTISGVELDYDGGVVSYDEARDRLAAADLNALLYTSPSHTEAAPRWRVLAPASRNDLGPEERRKLVARVNGVLGGVAAPESFVLSQAFYYGAVASNPDHRADIIDGNFINIRDDLDADAIFNDEPNSEDNEAFEWVFDIAATGYIDAEVEAVLAEQPVKGTRSTRFSYGLKLAVERDMTATDFEAVCHKHRDGPAGKYLINRSDLHKRIGELWASHSKARRASHLPDSFFAEELEQEPVEPVDWIVEDFIPSGTVTGLFGDGGTGKDLLFFQLGTCAVCGARWLGKKVKQGRVLYFPVEDTRKELRRRQAAIAEHYDIRFADFPGQFKISPFIGKDTVLAAYEQRSGVVKPTPLYDAIRKEIEDFRPMLVIVPNRVNIFSVNQNDDAQARQSMQYLYALAEDYATSVIMPGHVSVAGMNSNSGTSGTVQWSNACRSRLYLSRITEDHGEEHDPDARLIAVRKANWGPTDKKIYIRWSQGVFVPDIDVAQTFAGMQAAKHAEKEFLRMLDLTIDCVSLHPTSHKYAPKVFSEDPRCPLRGRAGKKALAAAMESLLLKGAIKPEADGPPSRRRERIVRAGLQAAE